MATQTVTTVAANAAAGAKQYTAEQKMACNIDAMINNGKYEINQ